MFLPIGYCLINAYLGVHIYIFCFTLIIFVRNYCAFQAKAKLAKNIGTKEVKGKLNIENN
ncbi:hypothetical protein CUC00_11735 [Prevotella intermedia]|nr:hypothetical protein CTM44_10870 [Prevotella intermedia]ATV41756.1 hypothetical protein CUC00_11735 [Prevotella intermedia]